MSSITNFDFDHNQKTSILRPTQKNDFLKITVFRQKIYLVTDTKKNVMVTKNSECDLNYC